MHAGVIRALEKRIPVMKPLELDVNLGIHLAIDREGKQFPELTGIDVRDGQNCFGCVRLAPLVPDSLA
jgi:hypothetical protein